MYDSGMRLRHTRRGWEEPRPSHCPDCGAALSGGQVLVGVAQCSCGSMHRTHTCRACQQTTLGRERPWGRRNSICSGGARIAAGFALSSLGGNLNW